MQAAIGGHAARWLTLGHRVREQDTLVTPTRSRVRDFPGEAPDYAAPFAERAGGSGGFGEHCTLGRDPSFAEWTCAAGFECSGI